METITDNKKKMTVDELLNFQNSRGDEVLKATIEPIKDNSELIKITPWLESRGCLCRNSIEINRNNIDHLIQTGDIHNCCGKQLQVVEVHFKDQANISLVNLFTQLSKSASENQNTYAPPHHTSFTGANNRFTNVSNRIHPQDGMCYCGFALLGRRCVDGMLYGLYTCKTETGRYCGEEWIPEGRFCPGHPHD